MLQLLLNMLFKASPLYPDDKNQFAFIRKGLQYTFNVLLPGYLILQLSVMNVIWKKSCPWREHRPLLY